jgi:hypothetical protein
LLSGSLVAPFSYFDSPVIVSGGISMIREPRPVIVSGGISMMREPNPVILSDGISMIRLPSPVIVSGDISIMREPNPVILSDGISMIRLPSPVIVSGGISMVFGRCRDLDLPGSEEIAGKSECMLFLPADLVALMLRAGAVCFWTAAALDGFGNVFIARFTSAAFAFWVDEILSRLAEKAVPPAASTEAIIIAVIWIMIRRMGSIIEEGYHFSKAVLSRSVYPEIFRASIATYHSRGLP